jgi:hypothetical protein
MSSADILNIQNQFLAISEQAESLARRLGPELIAARPRPEAWSVAECLIHVQITAYAYLPIWREACRNALTPGRRDASAPFRLDLWGRFFIWFIDAPPKLRFSAPGRFQPTVDRASQESALSLFLSSQDEVLKLISTAKDLPLDQIVIRSAFTAFVRYSLWSSLCANAAHHRRHLWQAERVAAALSR